MTDRLARIERLARARVRDRLVTFYEARKGTATIGYAAVLASVSRALPIGSATTLRAQPPR